MRQRDYYRKRKAEGQPVGPYRLSDCAVCGAVFNARKRAGSMFTLHCSRSCASIASNRARGFADRPPRKSEFRRRAERLAAKAAAGSSGGANVWVQGACIVCASPFMSCGAASRYCSRECRARNRARQFGLTWLDRMAIFARDGWCCQICSEPVDYSAHPLSDWYPSLDHIVPRSHGGSDDLSNLRTAHRWCNSVRGDLSFYTDADLVVPDGAS